ncbi:Extracellular solute-binding protein family 1, ABC transporter, solute-binding protein [Thermobacillus xylanilyticus]|uniref:Extracellular solute-binding protein family 1, ABC transporter, solute-binding protein n=1 Tax=Thermobacillus xylanilyticus TaxID=76633 RepID=A0ABM8UZE0_THEXY|nr:extracellular solute-binding protein [Thermobacillus xylanilyticus]CAG5076233.1 Extracellular solute-binding protein family 1, ABC transporter, solute-binding protein [Thermobacillus xylanilyticus]
MSRMMKTLVLLVLTCLVITACGGGNNNGNSGSGSETNSGSNSGNENTAGSGNGDSGEVKNEKLIVYTNSNSDGRGEWWIEQAKQAGFDIEIVGAGGADLTNRLIAEKNNPIADVVFGLNNIFYENLKKEGVLTEYVPSWAPEVWENLNDPEGYYHALVKQAIMIGYNEAEYTPETAPKSWQDLYTNEAFKGKYEAPTNLTRATSRLVVAGILMPYIDENGDLGISEEGWNELKKLYDNGQPMVEGEDLYANMAAGKIGIGTVVSGEKFKREAEYGVKVGVVGPEGGVPMVVEHIAIVNGTKKLDTAQRFVEWFGSAEMQGKFAAEFSAMPVIPEAADQAPDHIKQLFGNMKAQPLNWSFIAEHIDLWAEKIELQIIN